MHLSHCSGETISALNRTSAFKRDFAAIDSVRFSKSPCQKKICNNLSKKGAKIFIQNTQPKEASEVKFLVFSQYAYMQGWSNPN